MSAPILAKKTTRNLLKVTQKKSQENKKTPKILLEKSENERSVSDAASLCISSSIGEAEAEVVTPLV